jgi:IS5 family transposase
LIQESLAVAHKTGALATGGGGRHHGAAKAIAHPTDAGLCQSYRRLAKRAAIMVGHYSHAHQFSGRDVRSNFCASGWAE